MKVVFRADDVGYTHVHNLGTFKTMLEGFTTHCDVMLDWPDTMEALEFLKERPWISVGWHTHFWGYPTLPVEQVPSLVDETGRFKWRRLNQSEHPVEGVVYEELLAECRAQIEKCKEVLGRVPSTCTVVGDNGCKAQVIMQVCDEYGIAYNFMGGNGPKGKVHVPDEKYAHLHIKEYFTSNIHPSTPTLRVHLFDAYDPAQAIVDMPIEEDTIYVRSLHPGYLDDLVLSEHHCTIHRVKDVEAYCDPRVYQWILEHQIELINKHDALYGTSQYQDYLKTINSPLWMGNMKK